MKCVAIISRTECALFGDGVTLRSGGIDEELANALLDDMDFVGNRVKSRKIEGMMPKLMKMVEGEMR